jgi:hypothetical protein
MRGGHQLSSLIHVLVTVIERRTQVAAAAVFVLVWLVLLGGPRRVTRLVLLVLLLPAGAVQLPG